MERAPLPLPRGFAALDGLPTLRAAVDAGLRRQAARAAAALARFQARPRLLATLETALRNPRGGLVVLEGSPGSGVTSVLVALAVRQPLPLWLADEDAGAGAAALYAQIVALHGPAVALLDPTVATDPAALERLLAEAAGARADAAPLGLLIDAGEQLGGTGRPAPLPLPAELPRGVVVLLGCAPGTPTPYPPVARLRLPNDDPDLALAQTRALAALGCPLAWSGPLSAASAGNFLYLELALALLRAGTLELVALPPGLEALLGVWWASLSAGERRLATLLAAAGEPLPLPLAAELTGADPVPILTRWQQLGLVDLVAQAVSSEPDAPPGAPLLLASFAHGAPASSIARNAAEALTTAHRDLAALALERRQPNAEPERRRAEPPSEQPGEQYLQRQFARHAALGPRELSEVALPQMASRAWLRAYERRDGLGDALNDALWELRAAVNGSELRVVRAAMLAGNLATRARALSPAMAAEALTAGLERGGREQALKRVLDVVERLPDGADKATILRRLGEVCYGARMRPAAMRLLSRALDLEAQPVSRAWRDTRETLLAALAGAALELGATAASLQIAERIEHLERRAMVETQVVQQLIARSELTKAQRVARDVLHESMGDWARAEVAVAMVRTGDARGALMLEELALETVAAWVQIELACDEAASNGVAALSRIEAMTSPSQRDRGLARLAHALALAGNDGDALAAAERIGAVEVRVSALIDLRMTLEGLVAMLALERATSDIGGVTGDDRAPLLASLGAALAALGRLDRALPLVSQLAEGEEHDRALAKVALALAQRGEHEHSRELLDQIGDNDERAWAYDEIARLLAASGAWEEAVALCGRIAADDQRARTMADLALAQARAGEPVAALTMALAVELPAERTRALTLIAPLLVAAGAEREALAVAAQSAPLPGGEARGRYLAAVAAAMAEGGRHEAAAAVVATMRRPAERARAGMALARALVPTQPARARATLGAALRISAIGREEVLRALEQAAPVLALLGGAELLVAVAAAVDEIDRW